MKKNLSSLLFTLIIFVQTANAQQTQFASGSLIVDMGVTPQTVNNGLRPYGLVYDLVSNYDIPVYWIIKPNKLKDGIDFTYNGTGYKGGPFIIAAENRTPAVDSRIAYWMGTGVVGINTTSVLTAPVAQKITAVPRWTLDLKSGGIAQTYLENAGIPLVHSNWEEPYMLNNCNDIFVLPHADPKWASHSFLHDWNLANRGSIWVSCHAVSVLENMFNPSNPAQQTNFLAINSGGAGSNSLIDFKAHKDGSKPYNNNSYPADQVMQFMGPIDDAIGNGSESIYLPKIGGGWRPTTKIGVFDPTQIDIPTLSAGKAALIAYGRGFGDPNRGWVMYEAGHDHTGGEDGIAAQRAFLNFSYMATMEKSMNISVTGIQSVMISSTAYALSTTVTQNIPTGPYVYQWTSSCGGTFSNPAAASTTYAPPLVVNPSNCTVTLKVTDACGRTRLFTQNFLVTSGPRPPVANPDSVTFSPDCVNVNPVITINALANDVEPDGQPMTITALAGNNGTWTVNPDKSVKYVPTPGFYGLATANYTVCDNTVPVVLCAGTTIKVNITSATLPPTAVDDSYTIYEDSIQVFNVLSNDVHGTGSLSVVGVPINPKKGKVSVNINNTITYLPDADYNGKDSFYYKISSSGGYLSTAKVVIDIRHDCCAPGFYKRILGPIITTSQNLVATEDSYLKLKSATTNFGTDETIVHDRETTDKHVGVLKFDLSNLICYATLVRSASLKMQKLSGNDQFVSVYRLLNPWSEMQVTWNNRLTDTSWTMAGGQYNPADLIDQTNTPVANIFTWNMSAIMQNMVCNSILYPNHGFLTRVDETGGNRLTVFASREHTTAGVLRPTMQITFDSAAFICAPIPIRPPLAMPDTVSILSTNSVLISPLTNDQLPAGNTGTISIIPGTVTTGTAHMTGNQISYQPNLTFQGLTSFHYIITDNMTGLKDTAKAYVYVSFPPPQANDDSITILSGSGGTKNVYTNDVDRVGLGVNFSITSGPSNGTYTATGYDITYTAPFNFIGRDTITYSLTNLSAGACNEFNAADTGYFVIIVNNRPPIAANDTVSTNPCQRLVIDVLNNDSDPEGGLITIASVSAVSPAGAGTASISGSYIIFTPNPAYPGSSASFTYTIIDDATPPAASNPATVVINLSSVPNLPPVAIDDLANGISNSDIYVNVLVNDSDPENDSLSISLGGGILAPAHGSVSIMANGLIKYVPALNYAGTDVFEYRLHDNHRGISGGTCTNVSLTSIARVYISITNIFVILNNDFQNFTGKSIDRKNKLLWAINEVKGNTNYVIERSTDKMNFTAIGQVKKPNASDAGIASYTFYDDVPAAGINFYRIKVISDIHAPVYSTTLMLKNDQNQEPINLQAYPMPFSEMITVKFDLPKADKVTLSLLDANGKLLKHISLAGQKGSNSVGLFNLESFAPGMYYIKAVVNKKVLINKALKL